MHRRRSGLLVSLIFLIAGAAAAQGGASLQDRSLIRQKYRSLLERNPYHEIALEKTLEFAAEDATVDALVEEFEILRTDNPSDLGYRYVLAGLYLRQDRLVEAADLLQRTERPNHHILTLLAEIQIRQGKREQAAPSLERAASLTNDEKALRRIFGRLGGLLAARGEGDKAAAAIRKIAELDPESFFLRKEAAEALTEAGLHREALEELAQLLDLAGDDPHRQCSALLDIGKVSERTKAYGDAAEAYRKAIDRLRRGHWLRDDLEGRLIGIHRKQGTVQELIDSSRSQLEREPTVIDHHLFLAKVLRGAGELVDAAAVLELAADQFADDLDLGRRRIAILRALDDPDGLVREYQRLIAAHPESVDLYIELGRIFVQEGKPAQARLQWEEVLERNVQEASLCLRLAQLYANHDMVEEAIRAYERAQRIEPDEPSYCIALGDFLFDEGRVDAAKRAWKRMREIDGTGLLLAKIFFAHEMHDDALRVAEGLPEEERGKAEFSMLMVELHVAREEIEEAKGHARAAADRAEHPATQREAVRALVSLYQERGALADLIEAEEKRWSEKKALVPSLILAEAFIRTRQTRRAIAIYEGLLAWHPATYELVRDLAVLHEQVGDVRGAVDLYERLLHLGPGREIPVLRNVARAQLRGGDYEAAFETWRRMIRTRPDDPKIYREIGDAYRSLRIPEDAVPMYRRALELSPRQPILISRSLVAALRRLRDTDAAAAVLREALPAARDEAEREDLTQELFELLGLEGKLAGEIHSLERSVRDEPEDLNAVLLLADLYRLSYEHPLASELLERVEPYHRGEPRLLLRKARLLLAMEKTDRAAEAFGKAVEIAGPDRDRVLAEKGRMEAETGKLETARATWSGMRDGKMRVKLLQEARLLDAAQLEYESLLKRSPRDPDLLLGLAQLLRDRGDEDGALTSYGRLLQIDPYHASALQESGALWVRRGERERAVDCGKRLLRVVQTPGPQAVRFGSTSLRATQRFFTRNGLLKEWAEILRHELVEAPNNRNVLSALAGLYEQNLKRPDEALVLYDRLLSGAPSASAARRYRGAVDKILRQHPQLRDQRLDGLLAKDEPAPEDLLEGAALLRATGRGDEARRTLAQGATRFATDPRFPALAGEMEFDDGDFEEAARLFLIALEHWGDSDARPPSTPHPLIPGRARRSIPRWIRDNGTKAQFEAVVTLVDREAARGRSPRPWLPARRTILGRRAVAGFRGGDDAEAGEAITSILSLGEDFLNLAFIGDICHEGERPDLAESYYRRAIEDLEDREENPIHRYFYRRSPSPLPKDSGKNLASIMVGKGELVAAYDTYRELRLTKEGATLLAREGVAAAVRAKYEADREVAAGRLSSALSARKEAVLREYLTVSVKLAEVLEQTGRNEEGLTVLLEAAEMAPPIVAIALWDAVATGRQREADLDQAIEARQRIISLEREMAADASGSRESEGLRILRGTRRGGYPVRIQTRPDVVRLAKLFVENGDRPSAVRILLKHYRENPAPREARAWGEEIWAVHKFARDIDMEGDVVPVYRLLHPEGLSGTHFHLIYANALERAGHLAEAADVFESVVARGKRTSHDYDYDRAKERLEVIRRQLGTTDVSLEDLQTEIERDPKNVRARLKLGRLYESLGRYEDAVEQVEALLDLAPYHPEVYVLARDVQSRLGNRAAVIESLRKEVALKQTPYEKIRLLYRLGNYLELEGREEEAIEVWMQMKSPGRVQFGGRRAHLFIAKWRDDLADQVLQDQGTGDETAARMALFQGRVEEAVDRLYEIHRARPLDLEGFIKPSPKGADVFRWTLDPEDLAGPLRRRAEKTPDDARGWILLAVVLQGSLQYDKAIEALEKAHEASPHSREILQMLVEICDGAGAWERGVTYAERLLPIIPSEDAVEPNRRRHRRPYAEDLERESVVDYLARFHRLAGRPEDAKHVIRRLGSGDAAAGSPKIAELLFTHGFYEEAARELEQHLTPNRKGEVSLYEKLAEYLVLSGQPEKAKALLRERLTGEDDPEVGTRAIERINEAMMDWPKVSTPEAAREDGHGSGIESLLARAREAQRRGQIREAAEILGLAAERHPSEKEPLLRLYDLHREEGESEEAITALERLFEKFPSERQSLSTQLAHLYLRLGEISRALEAWMVARPDAPEDDVRFRLGKELQQRGRSRLAAEEYREAIRLAGSPSAREEYEEALNAITPSPEDAVKTFEQFSQALKRGPQSGAPFGWEEGLRYLSRQEPVRARVAEAEAIPPGERSKEDAWWVWVSALFGDDTEKAKHGLRAHLARFPDDIDAWRALSMALGWIGDRDGILEAYLGWKGAEERREGEVGWIWDRMGDLHFREGRKEDAIRCWRMAVRVGRAPLFEFGRGSGRGIDHGRYLGKLLRNGLEEEALQESSRALALGIVKPHEALMTMAAISFRRGDFEEALRYSVDTGATWIIGGTSMGRLARRTEHRDRVLELLDRHLRHRWTDRQLLDDFTRMAERIEEPELALPYLEAALERTPDDLSLQLQIGRALARTEQYDEARTVLEDLWRRIVLRGGKATYRFQTEGRRGSGSGGSMGHSLDTSQVGIQLVSVYESLGMIAEADALRGHMPSSQGGYPAVDLSGNAWELQKKGHYQEALRAVRRQLVNLAPPVHAGPFAHHQEQSLLGMELSLLRRLGRMDEAASRARDLIELHRGSIQLRPWEARSHSEIASIRSQYTREWDAALEGIETARDLLPHESWPVEEKAFILLRMGREEEAGGVFAEAEAIRLRRGGEIEGGSLLGRAIVAHRQGRAEEAKALVEESNGQWHIHARDWNSGEFALEVDDILAGGE